MLTHLSIRNFRIFDQMDFDFHSRCSVIYGLNGSGKTSFLEAIYFLFLGRSFRSRFIKHLVSQDQEEFLISGTLVKDNEEVKVGVRRGNSGQIQLKKNGENIYSQGEITKLLPIQLFNHESFALLSDPPKIRRQFIDWGVFYFKGEFLQVWHDYERILKQRNEQLRQDFLPVWDKELASLGERLHQLRTSYLEVFLPFAEAFLGNLLPHLSIKLTYYPGWNLDIPLIEILERQRANDIRLGYTILGAHRADLKIEVVNSGLAKDWLSRGQQKILIYALQLAQGLFLQKAQQEMDCLYLIDDPLAEMDLPNYFLLTEQISKFPRGQVVITGLNQGNLKVLVEPWKENCLEFDLNQGDCQRV